ncbi:hypothetical protein Z517_10066 [Fonsecaea pedrosoi CBS 271.37]|uniref:Carboxylic ester hydrolase n=1 Tax=Fonsecaea pedrosoi CBS 271.37 TaxID=1442368 RepID=A0A0D2GGB2_9EURO|nr:uncharacterized protein Z517_10066 [Fonsecaea pedrosoi CBS 271.37]KIW77620.1 hypothetical protein Z517_10066 [Fonsecaea pedrosoi CBS 271.37]
MTKIQTFSALAYAWAKQALALPTNNTTPVMPCEHLTLPPPSGLEVSSVQAVAARNYTNPLGPGVSLDFCNVTVSYNHPDECDTTWVNIWLPLNNWNGRFQATGGGGLAAGFGAYYLLGAAPFGYATGTTDGGLTLNNSIDPQTGQWALTEDGSLNESLVKNFAHRAIHDMTVIGKSLTQTFYGKAPAYSYYTGCSTGGRQGYFAAQVYPEDFDGIMANSPALNSPEISPSDFWPSVVMQNLEAPPQCVFDAYYNATLEYCDPLDGARDGLISNLGVCDFDPQSLVGQRVQCGGQNVTISATFANVVSRIWAGSTSINGESLFPGNPRGAVFSGLANTTTAANGVTVPVPFSSAEAWIKYLVVHDPNYPTRNMTFGDFDDVFGQSVVEFSRILGTMSPDLSRFKAGGGKLLTWHGLADPLITPYSTMLYRSSLSRGMALNQTQLNDFYRVFFAPGVAHCAGGIGPVPTDPLAALVSWVESHEAPETLTAALAVSPSRNVTRNLCPYPQLITYDGNGNVDDASSFSCA